ncbi:MAG: hypothetical protein V7699_00490 [Porticoccus sp.]
MDKIQAYIVGALLMLGSALWATIFAQNISSVIGLMAIPSVIAGYIYASSLPQYVWGMLLGICAYMLIEFQIYGPIYKITGIVYAVGFFVSLGCAILGYAIYRWKVKYQQKSLHHHKIQTAK